MKKPDDIFELLFMIKKRPGAFLGTKEITKLKHFLDGYMLAMCYENIDCGADFYHSFNDWIAKKYYVRESILWDTFLLNEVNDESKAFDLFFEELETFMKENDIEIPEIW